jgi:hypothetical protein
MNSFFPSCVCNVGQRCLTMLELKDLSSVTM